jgi:hypothetical protein
MRRSLLVVLSLCGATWACTSLLGDFKAGSEDAGGGPDSAVGSEAGDSGDDGGPVSVAAVAIGGSVYLGQTATVDGTQSSPSLVQGGQYSWSLNVNMLPPGSSLTQNDLVGATTESVSFTPDALGQYELELTVSADGMQSTPATTSVHAVLPQVFYASGAVTSAGSSASYSVVDFDGGNAHPVVCPDTAITKVPNEIATYASYAGRAYDFWEAEAGQPSLLAGFMVDYAPPDASTPGYSTHLYVAGATAVDAGCDAGVTSFLSPSFGPLFYGSTPHFSPDGSRFVVYGSPPGVGWNILTYPSNGQGSSNVVFSYQVAQSQLDDSGASGINGYVTEPPRVEWIKEPQPDGGVAYDLAWAQPSGTGWAIMTAPDTNNQVPPMLYMTCPGVLPREFAILDDGSVVASYRPTPSSPENLVHLTVGAGAACTSPLPYTKSTAGAAVATDFAVSPDGKQIAYLALDPSTQDAGLWMQASSQLPGGYVYVVPVDGSAAPIRVSPYPALFGPRWIGGGRWLVFTRLDGVNGSGLNTDGTEGGTVHTDVVIIQADGGGPASVVATGDGVTTFVSTSGSGACSMARGHGSDGSTAAGLVSLFAFAGVLRLRRRARSASAHRSAVKGRRAASRASL